MESGQPEFKWYEIVRGTELQQGDFLNEFPILIQPDTLPTSKDKLQKLINEEKTITSAIELYDVVVMTQSCDFNKIKDNDLITMCPRFAYSGQYGKNQWNDLRQGRKVGVHILNKCDIEEHKLEYQIVDLTKIFSVRYSYVKKFADENGERIRLLPPYREHLAQSFAKRFMRVGLPIDLPTEYPY